MRHPVRSWVLASLAAGVVGTALPVPLAHAEPAFGGYSTEATATPIKIEVYEPTIPVPASPQAEVSLAYTKVEAASGPTGRGVASWLWPGDPIGQGCKTFVEQIGLGETGLCSDGYPVQVNSRTPGEPGSEADEPFPGSLMRTSADKKGVRATVGWSGDGDVSKKDDQDRDQPDQPGPPDLPEDPLGSLGAAITGKDRVAAGEEPSSPGLPPELAALVDADGMVSISRTQTAGRAVQAVATSRLADLSVLGGLVTADSVTVTTTTTADGRKPTTSGVSKVVGLELAGTPIALGRDGVRLADERVPLPDLPDDPEKALAELGISLVLPKPERSTERSAQGDSAESSYEGLRVIIDTRQLRGHLDAIPFGELTSAIPEENLRSLVGAATQLAPRIVITAGNAAAETATVPKLDLDLPTVDPSDLNGAGAPPTGSTPGASGPVAGGGVAAPEAPVAAPAGSAAPETLVARPASAGLPPLASIPGALMVGGLLIAAGIGWWLQKIGGLVLGGAAACSHGLETGVPDLRRA